MNQRRTWEDITELPPEAQRQVMDFIAFLQVRYSSARPRRTAKLAKLANEAFIGMWRNREDLKESTAWIRDVRKREWVRGRA